MNATDIKADAAGLAWLITRHLPTKTRLTDNQGDHVKPYQKNDDIIEPKIKPLVDTMNNTGLKCRTRADTAISIKRQQRLAYRKYLSPMRFRRHLTQPKANHHQPRSPYVYLRHE